MKIGEAAERCGLPAKTLRYYEDIDLVAPSGRRGNGYRDYSAQDVHALSFVQRARSLGFSVDECRELLALYKDPTRASADVKTVAENHVAMVQKKIEELEAMKRTLCNLIDRCHGDDRPDCPILDELASS
jgi:Cu(I)-responsive transcriptional regulator